jgi:hypothetical protein
VIDKGAQKYLSGLLKTLPGFHAIDVDGDGNCLVHALSRCMCGIEMLYCALRNDLREELLTYIEFYMTALGDFYDADSLQAELLEAAEDAAPGEASEEMGAFNHFGKCLSPLHVFALANVLRRPIVLYSAPEDWGNSNAGVYLPAREGVALQEDGTPVGPLFVSWSSSKFAHFVSLIPSSSTEKEFRVPASVLPRTSDGQLLVFGPYGEDSCQPYMQDGCFVLSMRGPSGSSLEDDIDNLVNLWQEKHPDKNWTVHRMRGTMRHSQERQLLRLLAGGDLDSEESVSKTGSKAESDIESTSRYQAQVQKARNRSIASGSNGVVYTPPLLKGARETSTNEECEFVPLAHAAFDAMFSIHSQGSDSPEMNASQVQAWLQTCEADSGRDTFILGAYGEDGVLKREGFLRYYKEAVESRLKAVWADLVLHDFGFDLRPMGDDSRQYWNEPEEPENADEPAKEEQTENEEAVWQLQQSYGWTRINQAVSRQLEKCYQRHHQEGGPSKVQMRAGEDAFEFDIEAMTLDDLELMLDMSSGVMRMIYCPSGDKTRLRRRDAGGEDDEPEPESALPVSVAGLLQAVSRNMSQEQREQFFGGMAYAQAAQIASVEAAAEQVEQLVAMGFSDAHARRACIATRNAGVDVALEWLFEHPDNDDEDVQSSAGETSTAASEEDTAVKPPALSFARSNSSEGVAEKLSVCSADELKPSEMESLQPPIALVRAVSLSNEKRTIGPGTAKGGPASPPQLSRAVSAPPRLGLDWSKAWVAGSKRAEQGYQGGSQ